MLAVTLPTISWHRNRAGDVMVTIDLQKFKKPRWSAALSKVDKRWWLLQLSGLALGLGMAIGVSMRPDQLDAVPSLVISQPTSPAIVKVQLPDQPVPILVESVAQVEVGWWSQRQFAQHLASSAKPGDTGTIIIGARSSDELFSQFSELKLGQTISLTGSNQGVYRYQIVELRTIELDELSKLTQHFQETLLLYTTADKLGNHLVVVIARPG